MADPTCRQFVWRVRGTTTGESSPGAPQDVGLQGVELLDEGLVDRVVGAALGDDAACLHRDDGVGVAGGGGQVVLHHDDRAAGGGDLADEFEYVDDVAEV
ncbi:hypothetical protein OG530_03975 [Streptomyces decoyicus]